MPNEISTKGALKAAEYFKKKERKKIFIITEHDRKYILSLCSQYTEKKY